MRRKWPWKVILMVILLLSFSVEFAPKPGFASFGPQQDMPTIIGCGVERPAPPKKPTTTITLYPASTTDQTTATFEFVSNLAGSNFECALDSETWNTCSSPQIYTGLSFASHTFQVRAWVTPGHYGSTEDYIWTVVEIIYPDTAITSNPTDPTGSTDAVFEFTCYQSLCTFECSLDGGVYAPCTSPASYSGLSLGSHTFSVRARDEDGYVDPTPASYGWSICPLCPGHWEIPPNMRGVIPSPMGGHTAVWTGTEMIIWGGSNISPDLSGKYNPVTDSWETISLVGSPSGLVAVWTGTEMIVWGGGGNTGGRYNPSTDSWTSTSTGANVPTARDHHTAVWTGTEMIIWGGYDAYSWQYLNDGGRYNPLTDTWTPLSLFNAPAAREGHTAVWTGTEMIAWGGDDGDLGVMYESGGRYNPATDTWQSTSISGAPAARTNHTAVWTGTEMIVWGGLGSDYNTNLNDGGRYNPQTDTWSTVSALNAPSARDVHTSVWTGTEMIVWGGWNRTWNISSFFNTGGRYNPQTDTWQATSVSNAPSGRNRHTAVWTGTEMIIWGGMYWNTYSYYQNSGGRYNPSTDSWQATSVKGAPAKRYHHKAIWTGTEMIIWGGVYSMQTGGKYDPLTDTWMAISTVGIPLSRAPLDESSNYDVMVWTGTEMIVWNVDNGARYFPSTDTWQPISETGEPSKLRGMSGVWTGTEMIVWGGCCSYMNEGRRYNPTSDTWQPTSLVGAPFARENHSAVWTGTEMIIWGGGGYVGEGNFDFYSNSGGRYNPATDSWQSVATTGAPAGRQYHQAIWTGTEMLAWGGSSSSGYLNTGGRYNPSTDTWQGMSTLCAQAMRNGFTMTWTGGEVIIWGGAGKHAGGGFNPNTDSWCVMTQEGMPSNRMFPTAVWTGSKMIIWGGESFIGLEKTGGLYTP